MWGKLACAVGFHSCFTQSDDNGVWGECARCHRKFGYVGQYTLRRYAELEHQRWLQADAKYRAMFEDKRR